MTIQPIGETNIALYITNDDLRKRGLSGETLTPRRALELTREAIRKAGMDLEGAIEIEAYPGSCGVLVFARIKPPEALWLSFSDLEDLLAALRAAPLPPGEGAALYWYEDRWWLSLPPGEAALAARLSEFGCTEAARPHLAARMEEYGRVILEKNALSALKRLV